MSTSPSHFRRHASLLFLTGIFLMARVSSLRAQSTNSSLSGTVKDPSGAVVTSAELTLTANTTGAVKHLKTGGDGIYRCSALQAGSYTLEVSAQGFATFSEKSVILALNESA